MIPTKTTTEIKTDRTLNYGRGKLWVSVDDLKKEIGLFCNRPIKERTLANMLNHFFGRVDDLKKCPLCGYGLTLGNKAAYCKNPECNWHKNKEGFVDEY
mgnify:CR=1 FL=1